VVTQRDAATSLRLVSGAYREPPTRVARCGGFLALRRLRSSFVRAGAKRLMARQPWTSPSGAFLCPRARRSATLRELRGGSHWAIRRERVPSRACARSALRERVALTSWLGAGACKLLLCALSVLLSSSAWVYDFPADEHRLQLIRNATKYNDVPRLRELLSAGAPEEAATEIAVALLTAAKENKVPALKQSLVLRNKVVGEVSLDGSKRGALGRRQLSQVLRYAAAHGAHGAVGGRLVGVVAQRRAIQAAAVARHARDAPASCCGGLPGAVRDAPALDDGAGRLLPALGARSRRGERHFASAVAQACVAAR
jgi:hypothetical protein